MPEKLIQRNEKWPREYAREICRIKGRSERLAALERVPEKFRSVTKAMVIDAFEKRRHARLK